jgi:hypothetical protein
MGHFSAWNVLDELQDDETCEGRSDANGANDEHEQQTINLTLAQAVGKACEDCNWYCQDCFA